MRISTVQKTIGFLLLASLCGCQKESEDPYLDDENSRLQYAQPQVEPQPTVTPCEELVTSKGPLVAFPSCLDQARRGNRTAQVRLGALFAQGKLGAEDWYEAMHWFLPAAQQNHPEASYIVAQSYQLGRGIGKNEKEAFFWAKRSAEAGFAAGQVLVGEYYLQGTGVEKDPLAAAHWFKQGAKQKDPQGQYQLALLYLQGIAVSKDIAKAEALLKEAAEGEPRAFVMIGDIYAQGLKGEPDLNEAMGWYYKALGTHHPQVLHTLAQKLIKGQWQASVDPIVLLEKAAKQSYVPAQLTLAQLYHHDDKYKDEQRAFKWYLAAAAQNEPQAMHQLGLVYLLGELEQQKDLNIGVQYLKQAAAHNYYPAQYILASLFLEGHPVLKDRFQAIDYLRQAAQANFPEAQVKLAKVFSEFSLPQYDKVAYYWLEKAAQQQHPQAKFLLARFYYEGIGTEINYEKAFQYYLSFAQEGQAQAQFQLGKMYHYGQGVRRNSLEAMKWFLAAARNGEAEAKTVALRLFKENFTEDMIEQEPLAQEWILYAADNGDFYALFLKGKNQLYGRGGLGQNVNAALEALQKAANHNVIEAQNELAKIFEKGLFGLEDQEKAVFWYTKAAENGDQGAQYHLAYLYYMGQGIEKNYIQSYAWATLAEPSHSEASLLKEELAYVLNEQEIAQAQQLSQRYKQSQAASSL